MAITNDELYLTMPEMSEVLKKLSLTSQFKVSLDLNRSSTSSNKLSKYLTDCGIFTEKRASSDSYDFMCSEANLPSSSLEMSEEMGSRQGTIEGFATRRLYNEFDFTFYVDSEYNVLRLFEEWMNFISPINDGFDRYEGSPASQLGRYGDRNNFSRFRYPNDYKRKIAITKFERDFLKKPNEAQASYGNLTNQTLLTYQFIDAFPVNINAIPLTYEGSSITQVSVGFNYLRHTISKHGAKLTNTIGLF